MKYLALLYDEENAQENASPEAQEAVFMEYVAYEKWLAAERPGKKVGGEALEPTNTATCIRIRDGQKTVTDGPFAETREALGGFYVFEAENLDEAIALAERIPATKTGTVEVRPIMVFEDLPES